VSSKFSIKKNFLLGVLVFLVMGTIFIFIGRLWPEKFLLVLVCFILLSMILEPLIMNYEEKRKRERERKEESEPGSVHKSIKS